MEIQLDEIVPFLSLNARSDLKLSAVEIVASLTGSSDSIETIIDKHLVIVDAVVKLTEDVSDCIVNYAYTALVNLSGEEAIAHYLANKEYIQQILEYICNHNAKYADRACMILSNLTRYELACQVTIEILEHTNNKDLNFDRIVDIFSRSSYNSCANYHYLAAIIANLTRIKTARMWILNKDNTTMHKLLPYTQYHLNETRRRGIIAALRNCCFETDYNEWLLSEEVDILPHLLLPLAGPEELSQDETDRLPIDLQYLGEDKTREPLPDLRIMLIESIMQLCATKPCRTYIKNKMVYAIMRELHKWEKVEDVLTACEKLVQILIGDEPEHGMENFKEVVVPDKYKLINETSTNT